MIILDRIVKKFGPVRAVDGVSLEVERGEFFSLLGPSGCGKSTLLRTVAGFEPPTEGRVLIDGVDVTDRPPQKRPTAMVFQSYALFPNMTVGENVAYGLRVQKVPRAERRRRVAEALARVDLETLESRPIPNLSGGQQQRVALARALAVEPNVLLFDEPLSNLDVALRERTRTELKLLQRELGTTSLYVTHDQQEALALSDRVGVMRAGKLLQVDAPEVLYASPKTAFVAEFLGGSNVIRDAGLAERLAGEAPPDGHVLAVRPEHLVPAPSGEPARLTSRQFLGLVSEWFVEAGGHALRLFVDPATAVPETLSVTASQWRWVEDD
ncbi:MAG: ABC transporter ATP-binding protein [Bacteroidota bacterium]